MAEHVDAQRAAPRAFYAALVSLVVFFLFSSFAPVESVKHFLLDLACGAVFLGTIYCGCRSFLRESQLWPVAASLLVAGYCALVKVALVPFGENVAYVALGTFAAGIFLLLSPDVRASVKGFWKKTVAVSVLLRFGMAAVVALLFSYAVSRLWTTGSLDVFWCCAIGLVTYVLLWLLGRAE